MEEFRRWYLAYPYEADMRQEELIIQLKKIEEWPWEEMVQLVVISLVTLFLALMPFWSGFTLDSTHVAFYGFLVFLAALYRPGWVGSLLLATLPLEMTSLLGADAAIALKPYQYVTVLLVLALGVQFATRKIRWPFFTWSVVDGAVGILLIGAFLAVPQALAPERALKEAAVLASFVVLYGVWRYLFSQKGWKPFFVWSGGVSTVIVLLVALWQSIAFLRGDSAFMVMEGRPNSTFFEADWLGFFASLVVLMSIGLWWRALRLKQYFRQPVLLIGVGGLYALSFLILILTVARSAWLATFVGGGVLFVGGLYFVRKHWWKKRLLSLTVGTLVLISSIVILVATMSGLTRFDISNRLTSTTTGEQLITVSCATPTVLPNVIANVSELQAYNCEHIRLEEKEAEISAGKSVQEVNRVDPNFHTRSTIYRQSLTLIQEHWLLGIGGGNSSLVLGTDERGAGLNASNLFLEAWLSYGLLGCGALFFIVITLGYTLTREMLQGSEKHLLGLGLLVSMLIFNLFNAGMLLGVFFFLLAYLVHLSQEGAHSIEPHDFKVL